MASKSKLIIDDDQQFALMKFRRNVRDLLNPSHNDAYLLRWLRARNWNVEAAEKMFRESMNWRKQWQVDGELKKWVPPDVIKKYVPCGSSGYDRDGCPVYIVSIKGLDIVGVLNSTTSQEFIKYVITLLEQQLENAAKRDSQQLVVIFDLEEFLLRPYVWRPATEFVISLLQMYEANYPEILKVCYIINTPTIFSVAYNVIKRFLHEYTISKIHIYKSDRKKWQKAVVEYVDEDQLPQHYGGSLVDPDGDPKCPSLIIPGGKVPKSYYLKNAPTTNVDGENINTTVKKGTKLTLDYLVADEGCFLNYCFKTDGHDIKFGVTCKDEGGNMEQAIVPKRMASHQQEVSGVIPCKSPATYTVTFDNTYSLFKGKKLQYSIRVTDPISDLEITMLPTNDCDENQIQIKN